MNEGNGLIVVLEITILPQFNFHFVLVFFFSNKTWTCVLLSPHCICRGILRLPSGYNYRRLHSERWNETKIVIVFRLQLHSDRPVRKIDINT